MSHQHHQQRQPGEAYVNPYDSGSPESSPEQPSRHTQFLDLTNGEGGEGNEESYTDDEDEDDRPLEKEDDDDDDDASAELAQMGDSSPSMVDQTSSVSINDGINSANHVVHTVDSMGVPTLAASNTGGNSSSNPHHHAPLRDALSTAAASSGPSGGFGGGGRSLDLRTVNPNTPGKVVETGQEHTGRWTKEEHEAFLSALQMYGKEWKKVAAKVKTRTVVQTRTHAQKYFQKLAKVVEGGGKEADGVSHVDMGIATTASEGRKSSGQKKKRSIPSIAANALALASSSSAGGTKPPRQTSVTMAANVISNLNAPPVIPSSSPSGPSYSISNPTSILNRSGQHAVPQLQASLLVGNTSNSADGRLPATHGFSTGAEAPASTTGRSSFPPNMPYSSTRFLPNNSAAGGTGGAAAEGGMGNAFSIKIMAPEHDVAAKRGKFPEPSPAACGKRKLAEIAAARMLAGVAASSSSSDRGGSHKPLLSTATMMEHRNHLPPPSHHPSEQHASYQFADADGPATPPPEPAYTQSSLKPGRSVELKHMPAPPLVRNNAASDQGSRKPLGLSLQIVNPESLGVTYDQRKRRRGADGQSSPVTPWEGQLEALVSESKNKGGIEKTDLDGLPSVPSTARTGFEAHSFPHSVCGPGSAFGRSNLHKAVCEMDLSTIENELMLPNKSVYLTKRDEAGFCPIHSACCLGMENPQNDAMALDIVRRLLTAGADAAITDTKGNTPLHWAARSGAKLIAELLLLKSSPPDAKDERGETPLHWAMRAGLAGVEVSKVLIENGARPAMFSNEFKRPIDVTADGFHDEEGSVIELKKLANLRKRLTKEQRTQLKEAAQERREARANLLKASVQSRTLVLHHPECLEHIPKSASDWECPDRVTTIMGRLETSDDGSTPKAIYGHELCVSQEFDRAKLDLLSRVHSTEYLKFVNDLSKKLELQHKEWNGGDPSSADEEPRKTAGAPPVVPFTPMVQRSMIKIPDAVVKEGIHSDTSFSAGSLRAARRAAGAVQHAVDCVLVGRNRNAFCVVRPPGHHAGIDGLLAGGESCGFCIFNSVAAGAMHAISEERLLCERCAIVDIDVHHGNGTEEIVRKYHDPSKLFFFSIHLYDNEKKGKRESKAFQYKFYPGTGDEDDIALNIINVPISPLWKDKQAAPAVNVHNTRHRAKKRDKDSVDGDSSEAGTPKASDAEMELPPSRGPSSGTSSPTVPNAAASSGGRVAYRRAIQNRLLPALRAFNPDLILISAGFDASKGDVGNAKHEHGSKEKMGMDLEPEDYAWTTRKILEIADICCHGRVVSVLEGGYGRTPANPKADAVNEPLDKGVLGECAIRHLHAMIDPYDTEGRFSSSSAKEP